MLSHLFELMNISRITWNLPTMFACFLFVCLLVCLLFFSFFFFWGGGVVVVFFLFLFLGGVLFFLFFGFFLVFLGGGCFVLFFVSFCFVFVVQYRSILSLYFTVVSLVQGFIAIAPNCRLFSFQQWPLWENMLLSMYRHGLVVVCVPVRDDGWVDSDANLETSVNL